MNRLLTTLLALAILLPNLAHAQSANDWPWWRGPDRNGIANPDQTLPQKFSPTKNCRWSVPIPGCAHGSATVVGDKIFCKQQTRKRKLKASSASIAKPANNFGIASFIEMA